MWCQTRLKEASGVSAFVTAVINDENAKSVLSIMQTDRLHQRHLSLSVVLRARAGVNEFI